MQDFSAHAKCSLSSTGIGTHYLVVAILACFIYLVGNTPSKLVAQLLDRQAIMIVIGLVVIGDNMEMDDYYHHNTR